MATPAKTSQRMADWKNDLRPRGKVQEYLTGYAARLSIRLDKIEEAEDARTEHHRRTAPAEEQGRLRAKLIDIGHELTDPAADSYVLAHPTWPGKKPDKGPAPRSPELLVHLLETTAEGCHWLIERWAELAEILDEGLLWGTADERLAIRLLGKTPDAEDNGEIRELRLASCVMTGIRPQHVASLTEENVGRPIPTKEQARDRVRAICTRAIGRLLDLAAIRERDEVDDEARFGFDATEAGKELRRERDATHRALIKTLELVIRMQKRPAHDEETETAQPAATSPAPDRAGRWEAERRRPRPGVTRRRASGKPVATDGRNSPNRATKQPINSSCEASDRGRWEPERAGSKARRGSPGPVAEVAQGPPAGKPRSPDDGLGGPPGG